MDVMEVKSEPAFDISGSDDRSSSSSSGVPHTPNPNLLKKRGKYVQKACDHCKKKHVKCDGNTPICSNCISTDSVCTWESMPSKRGRKRKTTDSAASPDSPEDTHVATRIKLDEDDDETSVALFAPSHVQSAPSVGGPASFSVPPDPLFGHYFFVSANFFQRLRLFVDIPQALSMAHQPQLWSRVTSWRHELATQLPVNQSVALLVYSSTALVGALNAGYSEPQHVLVGIMEDILEEIINQRQLHLLPAFAPFADQVVSSLLTMCYHFCFFLKFAKWKAVAVQGWDIISRHENVIRPQSKQCILAMLLSLEMDPDVRDMWASKCFNSGNNHVSGLAQTAFFYTLSMLLPQRGDPTFDWKLRSLKFPQNAVSHTLLSACSAAYAALNAASSTFYDPALRVGEPAVRSMLAACSALASQALSQPDRAKSYARMSIELAVNQLVPDASGAKPTLPFFCSYPIFTSALLLVDSDRELCSRAAAELTRLGTPKTTLLASIINNSLATTPEYNFAFEYGNSRSHSLVHSSTQMQPPYDPYTQVIPTGSLAQAAYYARTPSDEFSQPYETSAPFTHYT